MAEYASLREKIAAQSRARRSLYDEFSSLHQLAHAAGLAAGNQSKPVPMIVGSPKTFMGNDIDLTQKYWIEEEGVCGFAWVHFPKGNIPFINWAKNQNLRGLHKNYRKGYDISCHEFNQSMQRKEAYCAAYAQVMRDAGIDCYPESRLD